MPNLPVTRPRLPRPVRLRSGQQKSEPVAAPVVRREVVVDSLESTNESSVLSHRLNDSIRVLTAFSVILLPLTLIASVYGMNVSLPFSERGEAFWLLMGLMAFLLVGLVSFFRRRGWL